MEINYLVILLCGVIAMVIGALWYGPVLFGKAFLKANDWPEWESMDEAEKEVKKKEMLWLYLLQFLFTLLQLFVLSNMINYWADAEAMILAFFIWLGYIMPTIAGNLIWNMTTPKKRLTLFAIMSGYQLVCIIVFAYILSRWG